MCNDRYENAKSVLKLMENDWHILMQFFFWIKQNPKKVKKGIELDRDMEITLLTSKKINTKRNRLYSSTQGDAENCMYTVIELFYMGKKYIVRFSCLHDN